MDIIEKVYINSDDFFSDLQIAIQKAQTSIYIETYIFDLDRLGRHILDLLIEAAQRNVRVYLMIDGIGSSHWSYKEAQFYRNQGLQIKFFHPLLWQRKSFSFISFLSFKKIWLSLSKLNHRNHRKIAIFDQSRLFICSMNISSRHLHQDSGHKAWRDTGVYIEGAQALVFQNNFWQTWINANKIIGRQWFYEKKQKKKSYNEILHLLKSAKKQIWITNPYFVPHYKLLKVLLKAARSGVDVRILIPQKSDILGLKFVMEGFYSQFLKNGCLLYEYQPAILHAKVLIIDDWVSVGSSNLDNRSLFYNLEADIVLKNQNNIEIAKQQFLKDLIVSKQIHAAIWKKRNFIVRIIHRFFLIFRDIV